MTKIRKVLSVIFIGVMMMGMLSSCIFHKRDRCPTGFGKLEQVKDHQG